MKKTNAHHSISALAVITLCFVPVAHAQTAPPTPPAAAAPRAPRAPRASSQVTVTRRGGCVTVKVCPGPRCSAKAAPAPVKVPAPPPAAPKATRGAPPKMVCMPTSSDNLRPLPPMKKAKPRPVTDPANTRLAVSNTAEVLGHGQWEVVFKQLVGLYEIGVGLGDRFQLTFKTSPITWFLPHLPLKEALWAGEIRVQLVRSRLFKLTADATYFHVVGLHGLKLGMSMKYGTDKLAFHAGIGTILVFPPRMTAYDTCAAPPENEDGSYDESYDCGGGGYDGSPLAMAIVTANMGMEARFWRYGKFFLDAFVAAMPGAPPEATIFSLLPGVRFHGKGFAADLGLGIFGVGGMKLPMPVINLSYRW